MFEFASFGIQVRTRPLSPLDGVFSGRCTTLTSLKPWFDKRHYVGIRSDCHE